MHKEIEPSILYFGTPVFIMSTTNEDGSTNIAPLSSIWWLGWSAMVGLDYIHPSRLNSGPEDAYAPWKLKGPKKTVTNFLLKILYRKYSMNRKKKYGNLN